MSLSNKMVFCALCVASISSQVQAQSAMLIRDVSWSNYTYFNDTSYYSLMPELYVDKITIREEIFEAGARHWIFNQFAGAIPKEYNINLGKMTMWNYDPYDALYVGIQGGISDITEASLAKMPVSKAIIPSGKTSDIRDVAYSSKEFFNIDQFIDLNYQAMCAKINRMRTDRMFNIPNAVLAYLGFTNIKGLVESVFSSAGVSFVLPESATKQKPDVTSKFNIANALKAGAIALPIARWLISCKVQNFYMDGFVKNFELLINYNQGVYNKEYAKKCIEKAAAKVKQFGMNRSYAQRLQALYEQL